MTISSSQISFSDELADKIFLGKWCGMWDGTYSTCLFIDSIEEDSFARYQWLEHPQGKFKKSKKKIERVNLNTLKIDNIWFVLDEKNRHKASAVGIFKIRTRIAKMTKEPATDN